MLLLDDVFSELDAQRAAALVRNLPPGQTLLTTAGALPPDVVADQTLLVRVGNDRDLVMRRRQEWLVKRADEPVPLRDAIAGGRTTARAAVHPTSLAAIDADWVDIVGRGDRGTRAGALRARRECTIAVDVPVWATQVRYSSSDLLARVNERCGEGSVTSIRVVVSSRRETR